MHWSKIAGSVAALVVAGTLGAALPGSAQKKPKTDSGIGYVDLNQITEKVKSSSNWTVMVKKFEDERSKFQGELQQLQKLRYLTPQEREELQNLRAKAKPTDKENERIKELEAKSDNVDREFQSLAGVEKPTAEQSKRLQDLGKLRETAITTLQTEDEKRAQQLQKMQGEMLEQMDGRIRTIVEQVADNRGVTLVIDRQMIWYGGQDLTPDVIKKLGN